MVALVIDDLYLEEVWVATCKRFVGEPPQPRDGLLAGGAVQPVEPTDSPTDRTSKGLIVTAASPFRDKLFRLIFCMAAWHPSHKTLCLSVSVSLSVSICVCVYLYNCISVCLPISLVCQPISLFVYLSISILFPPPSSPLPSLTLTTIHLSRVPSDSLDVDHLPIDFVLSKCQ